jgi:sterol desaturase/sphingolipid hydroxylase (fatty acid hydroxylase superfamily)
MDDVVLWALPVFALLMGAEFAWGRLRGRDNYGYADTIASLSQGLLSQLVATCTQVVQVGLYALAYPHLALTPRAALWTHWEGLAVAVLLYDFCDYWLHRVSHESAIFWAAHAVHHQSRRFNLSTALRQESAYLLTGWPFFLPLAVVGVPPAQFALAAVVVLFYQFWIHTEHVGALGALDRWLSTPSNHRVHHATNPRYLDRNYGAILVVWDRLFGSFEPEHADEPCTYGTVVPLAGWDPLRAVGGPYAALLAKVRRTPRWRDRLRVPFKSPSWVPPGLGPAPAPAAPAVLEPAPPPTPVRVLAGALFLLAAAATAGLLARDDALGRGAAGAAALGIAAALWCAGALLDGRRAVGAIAAAGAAALFAVAAILVGA